MHTPKLTYLDNPLAKNIFADGFAGVQTAHGLVRITLATWRHDYTNVALLPGKVFEGADMVCTPVAQVIMTPAAAQLLALAISDLLKAAGVLMPGTDQGSPPDGLGTAH